MDRRRWSAHPGVTTAPGQAVTMANPTRRRTPHDRRGAQCVAPFLNVEGVKELQRGFETKERFVVCDHAAPLHLARLGDAQEPTVSQYSRSVTWQRRFRQGQKSLSGCADLTCEQAVGPYRRVTSSPSLLASGAPI